MTDFQLLQEFHRTRRQELFEQLVARHVRWVHSVALRRVHDGHLAEDVTQAVFLALAQNAGKLGEKTVLSGWLFGVARYASLAAVRREKRRQIHEKEAAMGAPTASPSNPEWQELSPLLDELVGKLNMPDRQAILLRYYQRQPLAEIAGALGTTEEAARKRVTRALEKLRALFGRRGVVVPSAALATTLLAHAADAAPPLVQSVAAATTAATRDEIISIAKGALTMLAIAKARLVAAICAAVLVIAVPVTMVAHRAVAGNAQGPAAALTPAGNSSQNAEDAAALYRQAFALVPNGPDDTKTIDNYTTAAPAPATMQTLQRANKAIQLLHRAAAAKSADWGMPYDAEGLGRFMSDISQSRRLACLGIVRARCLFAEGKSESAAEQLLDVMAIARHLAAEPIMIGRLSAVGTESLAIVQTAENLPQFSRKSLNDFPPAVQRLPEMPPLKLVVLGEKRYAAATALTGNLGAFYDRVADAVASQPDQFEKTRAEINQQAALAGAFAANLLPAMIRAYENEQRLVAMRQMLLAAIAVQRDGEAAMKSMKDPFGDGPFTYRKLPNGFELESKLRVNNKPVVLTAGAPQK